MRCEVCVEGRAFNEESKDARYALSLSLSNSGANINFVCAEHFTPQMDFMLDMKVGSVDVQAMWIPQEEQQFDKEDRPQGASGDPTAAPE